MDLEVGHYNLISKENVQPNFSASEMSPSKQQYKNCLAQSLFSQAIKPEECKILALKRKAPAPKEGFQNRLRVLYTQNNVDLANSKKQGPRLPQAAERVLDAPSLLDDYYLNLLDWSSSNLLSIALSTAVYVWNATTSEITKLVELDGIPVTSVSWAQTGPYLGTKNTCLSKFEILSCSLLKCYDLPIVNLFSTSLPLCMSSCWHRFK
jgi:cell division cycle protein 20 (cofactor of APC complex)